MKKTTVQPAGALTQEKQEHSSLEKRTVEGFLDAQISQSVSSAVNSEDTTKELIERCFMLADRLTITNRSGRWQVRGRSRVRGIKNYTSNEDTLYHALRNFLVNAIELYRDDEKNH